MTKIIKWHSMDILDKDCFKEGKKYTPDCPSYNLGWLYFDEDD